MRKREKFGDPDTVKVNSTADLDATIEQIRIEKLLKPLKNADVAVRVRNKGEADWTLDRVDLSVDVSKAVSGKLNTLRSDWLLHVPLKAPVPAGQTLEFRFKVNPRHAGKMILR